MASIHERFADAGTILNRARGLRSRTTMIESDSAGFELADTILSTLSDSRSEADGDSVDGSASKGP